ncbi:MAG: signal peptide peptidase SppA [Candidatus Margulisbacteria bacterium]|nr:signal peptide peptidase SppA [Candidatus Margulisiibacteriota bacterium]
MSRLFNCFLVFLLLISPCLAQSIEDYALRRGIGVRADGMGGAYTAIADDASAVFYNPAALAKPGFAYTFGNPDTEQKNITGTFELLKLGYVGYGSWKTELGTDEVSVTAVGFGNRSGWLSWGLTYKGVGWDIGGTPAEGWSSDIGFLMRITPQFDVGIVAQDLFTSKNSLMPAGGRLGIGFHPFGKMLVLAADLEFNQTPQRYGHFGIETNVAKGLAIRGGIDRGEPTAGLTLDLALFSFDYASRFSASGQASHRFEAGIKVIPSRIRPFSIIKPKEYALIDVSGAIKGGRTEYSFLGGLRPGLDSILSEIRLAAKDSSIDGIMLRVGGFGGGLGGMAIVQEIRAELKIARDKGKKIVAYIEGGALGDEYYLAAFADKIVAPPGAAIGGFGKSVEILRIKGAFKKLGIEWQVFTQGKYKAAFDPYQDEFTPEQEAMVKDLVADLYRQMLTDISKDRQMSLEEIKEIGDGMIFPARLAQQMGLIDDIGYYRDARKLAAEILGEEKEEAQIVAPKEIQPDEAFLARVFGVAVIEIDGEIISGVGGENIIFGGRYVGSETVGRYIRKASDDLFVKAIILRIDSPGGDAIASGEIYKAIKYAKEKKKVVIASIGSIGASGGYYIAAAADKIVADKSSITGSIGVVGHLPIYKDLLEKFDARADVVKEGEHADMFSGLRQLSSVEVFAIERLQKESYDEFINAVVEGRGLATAEVEAAAQGRIYTGNQALDLKLIDQLGSFSDAVDLAKEEAKIVGEPRLIFYHEPSLYFSFGEGVVESLGLKALPLLLPQRN